jgi:hypothetical protein
MTIYVLAYLLIGLATFIAVKDNNSVTELIACALVGLTWPLFFTVRLIRKAIH